MIPFLLGYLVFSRYPGVQTFISVLVVVLCALPRGRKTWRGLSAAWAALARRRWLAILVVGLIAFSVTAALAIKRGFPLPYVHDEFSYLLAGDTYAHGRLTNPTPPIWEPFESMHILLRPTYMSKYPPGQGLFLALGQILAGAPIWGVWISGALAAAAACWMLLAFVPPRWALLGGLIAAVHPQMLEWGQRYWGGYVAVLGGALLLGGIARLIRQPRAMPALLAATGILILAITRPYEGFVLTAMLLIGLAFWMRKPQGPPWPLFMRSTLLPALLILIPGAVWMGYYNWRITGSAWRLPYQEHQTQYGAVPLFIIQKPFNPPSYNHKELATFYAGDQRYDYLRRDSWSRIGHRLLASLGGLYLTVYGNAHSLVLPLLILPWVIRTNRRIRWLVILLTLFVAALLVETFLYGHYAAPAAGVVLAIEMILMRRLYRLRHPVGPLLVRISIAVFFLWSLFWWLGFFGWQQDPTKWQSRRERVHSQFLGQKPGKHLALVRYRDHNVHEEWVYNGADLNDAKVIWAREMDPEHNRRLLEYYKDRQVWLIEPDSPKAEPKLYAPGP
jgi:hypothetical protein